MADLLDFGTGDDMRRTTTLLALLTIAVTDGDARAWRPAEPAIRDDRSRPRAVAPYVDDADVCRVWRTALHIARTFAEPIGFEVAPECVAGTWPARLADGSLALEGLTAREAFDQLTERQPTYRWVDVGGVPVLRPRSAWGDPNSALSQRTRAFAVSNAGLHEAVHAALGAADLLLPHPRAHVGHHGVEASMQFRGGSLLDALNAIAVDRRAIWQMGNVGGQTVVMLQALDDSRDNEIAVLAVRPR